MRIAIISDIHGNLISLEAVLLELKTKSIDQLVCLGDVAELGPQPQEVIQRLKVISCPVVMGNADEELLSSESPRTYKDDDDRELHEIDRWGLTKLSSSDLDFIRSFKRTVEIPLSKRKTLLCYHGSPKSNTLGILSTTSEEDLERMLPNPMPFINAGGHTHAQMFRRFRNSMIINPGSVGLPIEFRSEKIEEARNPPWAEFAIMDYEEHGKLEVDFCRVPVDISSIVRSASEHGMPHAESWAKGWDVEI
jgi:predicted phosphodiesterase